MMMTPRKGCGRPKSQRLKDDDDAKERMRTVKDDDDANAKERKPNVSRMMMRLMTPRKGCPSGQAPRPQRLKDDSPKNGEPLREG